MELKYGSKNTNKNHTSLRRLRCPPSTHAMHGRDVDAVTHSRLHSIHLSLVPAGVLKRSIARHASHPKTYHIGARTYLSLPRIRVHTCRARPSTTTSTGAACSSIGRLRWTVQVPQTTAASAQFMKESFLSRTMSLWMSW